MRKHTIPGLTAEQKQQNHGPCSNTLKTKKIEAALMLFDCIEDLLVFFLTFILSYRNLSNSQIVGRTFKLLMTFQQTLKNEGLKCDPSKSHSICQWRKPYSLHYTLDTSHTIFISVILEQCTKYHQTLTHHTSPGNINKYPKSLTLPMVDNMTNPQGLTMIPKISS